MTDHLTYQWLTPLLIGIIGWMIKNYLASMDLTIKGVKEDLLDHIKRVESFMKESDEKHILADKRITRMEDHVRIK